MLRAPSGWSPPLGTEALDWSQDRAAAPFPALVARDLVPLVAVLPVGACLQAQGWLIRYHVQQQLQPLPVTDHSFETNAALLQPQVIINSRIILWGAAQTHSGTHNWATS